MVQKLPRRKVLTGIGVAGALGVAGCLDAQGNGDGNGGNGGNGNDTGNGNGNDTDDGNGGAEIDYSGTVRYGVLMPETGDLGSLGGPIRDGALLVESQLSGSLEFDVQTGDTETQPSAGQSAAQNLVDAGMPAVVGPAASNVNMQVTRSAFIPNQVVGISPASTSPAVTDLEDDGYIFRTCPSDALQGPVMSDVVMNQMEGSSTATLYLNDDYGQALESSYASAFEEAGGEVTNQVSFEAEQSTYSSQLGDALSGEPDVLMVVGFPQSGITLFRDYYSDYASDWDGQVIVPDGLIDDTLPGEVGNDMEDVWGTAPSSAGPGADFFADRYEEEFGSEPGVFNGQAYDAAAVITLATVAVGGDEADGTAIRDAIPEVANPEGTEYGPSELADAAAAVAGGEEINYVGASSPVDFDENGDVVSASYDVMRYQGGGLEVQDTIDYEAE
ncbi:ABC transporter substrate-binding protein [Natronosalvus rutilus]|uniref:ABC transporter substrate-binding protein n=1 Tax=Natronosalvus rutilus TaxID=2953753 RepID=A0A9E7SST3_9EURY|nr:ABC transporter substrate-binding protein [Natronosalvus rutilus]UTF52929.1 ABC transporter substrate-binding protein [Natronosalvus rutilus]